MTDVVVVASVGFTTDFVMRRLYTLRGHKVSRVVAVALDAGDKRARNRVVQAYSVLSGFLRGIGVDSRLEWVSYGRGMIGEARSILARAVSESGRGFVDLFLTGGLRILVVTLLLAALTLPESLASRVQVTSYGEAFDATLSVNAGHVRKILGLRSQELELLRRIAERSAAGPVRGTELMEVMDMPKSTIYKKLSELEDAGLITRKGEGWVIAEGLEYLM